MPDSSYLKQKASIWAPFVFLFPLIFSLNVYALDCGSKHYDQKVTVTHIYDGDTIRLSDGRKLRLIGINAPERGRDGQPDQPFYAEAKKQLRKIISQEHNQVNIVIGNEKHDHYKRLLAHIFTSTGKNISANLLRQGLGYSIAVPPNLNFLSCYKSAEEEAKKLHRGIWDHSFSKPIRAATLTHSQLGFQRVIGKVYRVGESRSSFWLNLDKNFALKINKKYLANFSTYQPSSLLNKQLIAQGWIYYQNNEFRMSVNHPASIQLLNAD